MDFDDRLAVVTGAAHGIGAATAEVLESRGARVVRVDVDPAVKDQRGPGPQPVVLDVVDHDEVRRAVAEVEAEHGPIDLLAHAAGVLRVGSLLDDTAARDLRDVLAVNTFGALAMVQQVGIRMAGRRRGSVVVIGSDAAHTARTNLGAYGASKAATAALVRSLGLELAPHGVRCNLIAPGATNTRMQDDFRTATAENPAGESSGNPVIGGNAATFRVGIPLGRIAEPDDIAHAAAFLLSDEARHITLQCIRIDGGAGL